MKLEFDQRMSPKVRKHWFKLYPWRPPEFWWRVGCTVRVNRVRHKDNDKIVLVCRLIDATFPHYQQRKQSYGSNYRRTSLPSY